MDNASWGYTGPVGGFRQEVSFTGSPAMGDNGIKQNEEDDTADF